MGKDLRQHRQWRGFVHPAGCNGNTVAAELAKGANRMTAYSQQQSGYSPQQTVIEELIYSQLGTDEDLAELIELFVSEIPERLAILRRLAEKGQHDELARYAHQLKGAGGSYGFPELTAAAASLERAAKGRLAVGELTVAWNQLADVAGRLRAGSGA
jgi:HPt (histidine-containing phosphotransfer) domain-containing protein